MKTRAEIPAVLRMLAVGICLGGIQALSAPAPSDLVDVRSVIPDILLDLRYATEENFTGRKLYPVARCFLRRRVAERLKAADAELRGKGYRIKIWDGYRPWSVQREMWKAVPNSKFVANPSRGSRHNRGAALDVTLTGLNGEPVEMPTPYDTFTREAHAYHLFSDARGQEAMRHRKILQEAMTNHGFQVMATEWWHFDAAGWQQYPLEDVSLERLAARADQ